MFLYLKIHECSGRGRKRAGWEDGKNRRENRNTSTMHSKDYILELYCVCSIISNPGYLRLPAIVYILLTYFKPIAWFQGGWFRQQASSKMIHTNLDKTCKHQLRYQVFARAVMESFSCFLGSICPFVESISLNWEWLHLTRSIKTRYKSMVTQSTVIS